MNAMQNFAFEENLIRVIIRDGDPWFVLNDVCRVLEIKNARDAASRLDDDEKGVGSTDTLGGIQEQIIINESGLYSLILTSRKPEAKKFKKWVTSEVLPSIRRTGSYNPDAVLDERAERPGALLPSEQRIALQMVTEARLLFGRAHAREVWRSRPELPQVASPFDPEPHISADSRECLQFLLDHLADEDCRNVADLIVATKEGEAAAFDALERLGIAVASDGLWLGVTKPSLKAVFRRSPWPEDAWVKSLRRIPGVTRGNTRMTIGGMQVRPLWLPYP